MVRVQSNGKRRDIGIGSTAELSLADAREAARRHAGRVCRWPPRHPSEADALIFANNVWKALDKVRDRVPDMVLIHGGDTKGVDRIASS